MLVGLEMEERIRVLNLIPTQGNLVVARIVNTLRDRLSISEEEIKEFEIEITPDRIKWKKKPPPKEIEMGDMARSMIAKALKDLEKEEKLLASDVSLWDKFVGEEEEDKDES